MTARKPKSVATVAAEKWAGNHPPSNLSAHLAGQRTGYERAKKEAKAKLREQHATALKVAGSLRAMGDLAEAQHAESQATGVYLSACALGIKLESV